METVLPNVGSSTRYILVVCLEALMCFVMGGLRDILSFNWVCCNRDYFVKMESLASSAYCVRGVFLSALGVWDSGLSDIDNDFQKSIRFGMDEVFVILVIFKNHISFKTFIISLIKPNPSVICWTHLQNYISGRANSPVLPTLVNLKNHISFRTFW